MSTTGRQPPEHLDDQAAAKWAEVVAILEDRGDALDAGTLDAATAYASAYSRWRAAEKKVQELGAVVKSPAGFAVENPYVGIARKAEIAMRQWAGELRLTPKTRGKTKPPEDGEPLQLFGGIFAPRPSAARPPANGKPRARKTLPSPIVAAPSQTAEGNGDH